MAWSSRSTINFLLAAIFLFGLSIISILPPFEGVDETAHFSRLQSQAFFPQAPAASPNALPPAQHISTYVFNYAHNAPMPGLWIAFAPLHDKDPSQNYLSYRDFFGQPPAQQQSYDENYRQKFFPAGFEPSPQGNWQYQHPPLFYVVTAPLIKLMAGHLSLIGATFLLRIWCYGLAFLGLAIGTYGTRKYLAESGVAQTDYLISSGLLYPFLAPEFFWEFARIGNDGLLLFLFGLAWAALLRHLRNPNGDAWLLLGFCLGAGCLVKALMLPICAGIVCFLIGFHIRVLRRQSQYRRNWWSGPVKIAALTVLIGAPIYVIGMLNGGGSGSGEMTRGFIALLADPARILDFPWTSVLYEVYVATAHAIWIFGSWSGLTLNAPYFYETLYISTGLLFLCALREKQYFQKLRPAILWIMGFFYLGLLSHIIAMFVLSEKDGYLGATPGNYLHIIAPCFVLVYGAFFTAVTRWRWAQLILQIAVILMIVFDIGVVWSYMTAFAGCTVSSLHDNLYWIKAHDVLACTGNAAGILRNLSLIAFPYAGVCFAVLSLVCLVLWLRSSLFISARTTFSR